VTDICEHRNGLLFALDDPRLRQNTPPLHYQCRSILSPVSGYRLEKMGGKARLDADRAKMDEAPDPQVTKKGRFGNEPWPDVQGGAPPVPRVKPVGPKPAPARTPDEMPVPTTTPAPAPVPPPPMPAMPVLAGKGAAQAEAVRDRIVQGFALKYPAAWRQVRDLPAVRAIVMQASAAWWLERRGQTLQEIIAEVAVAQAVAGAT